MTPLETRTAPNSHRLAGIWEASAGPGWGRRFGPQTVAAILGVLLALLLGVTIGEGKWLFVVAIAAVTLVVLRPVEISLGAFALLVPFDTVGVLGSGKSGTTLNSLVGAITAVVLILLGLAGGRLDRPRRDTVAWALFVGWAAISTLWARDLTMALAFLPTALALLTLYFAAVSIRFTRREFGWVIACTIVGGLIAALFSIYSFRHGISYHGMRAMRSSLIIGDRETDPNDFANTLLLPFSLTVGIFLGARRGVMRICILGVAAILLIAIFLTMSRGGLLSLLAIAVVFAYRFRLKLQALIPVAVGGFLLLAVPGLFFQRIAESIDSGGAGRTNIWKVGLASLKSYGLFGAGLGNFPAAYDRFKAYAPHFEGYSRASHNIYLGVFVELGIVGVILLVNALRTELRGRKFASAISPFHAAVACEAASWGMLVGGFFLDVLWRKGFWLVWILLAVASRLQEPPVKASEPQLGGPLVRGRSTRWAVD